MEITKLTRANTAKSLRTTVPTKIVEMLKLNPDSYIKWAAVEEDGVVVVKVEPVR